MVLAVVASAGTYTTDPGPLPLGPLAHLSLRDPERGKNLPVTIIAPRDGGPYPIIIFSHGAGLAPMVYGDTLRLWASHGYVILAPVHSDSVDLQIKRQMMEGDGEPVDYREAMHEAVANAMTDSSVWVNRAKDIVFLLNSIPNLPDRVPELAGKMDGSRIGIAGHSIGAQTAALLAGATIRVPEDERSEGFADPRVKCAILMSSEGTGAAGLTEQSWKGCKLPMLVMVGTDDLSSSGEPASWKLGAYKFAPDGEKFAVMVANANHMSFCSSIVNGTDAHMTMQSYRAMMGQVDQNEGQILSDIELPTIPFWDAYLKKDAKALAYLKSGQIPADTQKRDQWWAK
jgi:dienelactone hydrolase